MQQIVTRVADELADASPEDILCWAIETFRERICVTSSMTDAVIVHIASAIRPGIDVIFLDTGYHFAETIGTRDAVVRRLPGEPDQRHPVTNGGGAGRRPRPPTVPAQRRPVLLSAQGGTAGAGASGYDAWITGVRRDETVARRRRPPSPGTEARDGQGQPDRVLGRKQVDDYIAENGILVNPLVYDGYLSIGCRTCTLPGRARCADPRSGRWAGTGKTECGIHL